MTMFNINDPENYDDGYYHISKDVADYPDATIYIVWSRRGPGKTYSALRFPYHKFKTVYIKRTADDVQTICLYNGDDELDPSPWVPLNRDFGLNVKPKLLAKKKGLGAFYDCNEEGNPCGAVISYIVALNSIKTVKGTSFDADWIIFDEFIPQPGEIIRRDEGRMLLNFFETVNRDRRKRGKPGLKLILMANAEEISTPVTNALDVIDSMVEMSINKQHKYYDAERGILLHHISKEECPRADVDMDLERAMKGTSWAAVAYEGDFAFNDFSNVKTLSIKGMRCLYHLHYNKVKDAYIYLNPKNGVYYMCHTKGNFIQSYDLDRENQQKKFHLEHGIKLKQACINDHFYFEKYTYYDLIINFSKFYNL